LRGLIQRAHDAAPGEIDLEIVVAVSFGVAQNDLRGFGEGVLRDGLTCQNCLGFRIAPGFVGDAAECQPCLANGPVIDLKRGRDGNQRWFRG